MVPAGWSPAAALAARRIAVVVNGKSRRGRDLFQTAVTGLEAAGFTVTAAQALRNPRLLGPMLDRLIADGHDVIAVGGGDGTLAMAAGKLAGKPVLMAVLPSITMSFRSKFAPSFSGLSLPASSGTVMMAAPPTSGRFSSMRTRSCTRAG